MAFRGGRFAVLKPVKRATLLSRSCREPGELPISLAIAVIKSSFILNDQERRRRLEQWATDRLNLDPILGASQLLDYFSASLDAGATQLAAIWRLSEDDTRGGAVAQAIDRLLATRPAMPPEALRSLVQVAGKHLNAARLQALAEAALADPAVVDGQRAIWASVGFTLDPVGYGGRLIAEHSPSDTVELFDGSLMDGLIAGFHVVDSAPLLYPGPTPRLAAGVRRRHRLPTQHAFDANRILASPTVGREGLT
jgi:hypothetical protein